MCPCSARQIPVISVMKLLLSICFLPAPVPFPCLNHSLSRKAFGSCFPSLYACGSAARSNTASNISSLAYWERFVCLTCCETGQMLSLSCSVSLRPGFCLAFLPVCCHRGRREASEMRRALIFARCTGARQCFEHKVLPVEVV